MKLRNFIARHYISIARILLVVSLITTADFAVTTIDAIIAQRSPAYIAYKVIVFASSLCIAYAFVPLAIPEVLDFSEFDFTPRAKVLYVIGLLISTGFIAVTTFNSAVFGSELLARINQIVIVCYLLYAVFLAGLLVAAVVYRVSIKRQNTST